MVVILDEELLYALWENKPVWFKRRREEQDRFLKWEKSTTTIPENTKTNGITLPHQNILFSLTPVEIEILKLIEEGFKGAQKIGDVLGLSMHQVKRRYRKLKKLGLIDGYKRKGVWLTELGKQTLEVLERFLSENGSKVSANFL